ncbi:MAG: UDP-N-acetylenolpyruvoylglucosamine reductase [Sphingobacteriales bacterium]|nr:UDP-N-acetylenolpyruvoylglucosamine reductase [Sphingobacteriales bacterium]
MPSILENFSLKNLNTFGVEAIARWYVEINSEHDLQVLLTDAKWFDTERLVIGGGSNMLFTRDFNGLVIRVNIKGIEYVVKGTEVYLKAGGGEVWNDLVNYAVDHNFAGMENLSLIPGSVGASPIQNIGAYGVEIKDIFYECRAFEIETGTIKIFNLNDCVFSYRDSIFKTQFKGKFIITQVTYKLSTLQNINTSYGAINEELLKRQISTPSVKDISQVVSHIRISKLPDPSTIGNAGSFFKNPIIEHERFLILKSEFPDIVGFKIDETRFKLAAGWLIEQCGWKGMVFGNTGTWKNQALVIVNHGQATGLEIFNFSHKIIESVKSKFGIILDREVNII